MSGVKWRRQGAADQSGQVGRRFQSMFAANGHQPLVFDLVVVFPPSPSPAVAGVTQFLNFHEQHFERQAAMRENIGEMDHLVEQVEELPAFGTEPPARPSPPPWQTS